MKIYKEVFTKISIQSLQILFTALFFFSEISDSSAQKIFFSKLGKSTSENQAYYYRQKENSGMYKSYYVNGDSPYFEGKILNASDSDENENLYSGACTWYFKNGKKKAVRNFGEKGTENGISYFYYESGKLWKEIKYDNGQISNNNFLEYDEDGRVSKIWEEDFSDNKNDWDIYTSDQSSATLDKGAMELVSHNASGTSRFINIPVNSKYFVIEAALNISKLKTGERAGILYGFKDWQNYNFFLISSSSFFVGTVYEGVKSLRADGMFSGEIDAKGMNILKIISQGEKSVYSINGAIQITSDHVRNFASNFGFGIGGKSTVRVEKFIYKEVDFKSTASISASDLSVKANGSGFVFSPDGYILTNYHVVENANQILAEHNFGGISKTYTAVLVQKDIDNDIAILKIRDEAFKPFEKIRYSFKESGGIEAGAGVFTIGYPYALSGMGKEAKFSDGKISSKTGYNGAINSCQTSIPVQPGNSGGPLFNDAGQLVGIINSKIKDADNVSYAIKLNYLKNLIELLSDNPSLPNDQSLGSLSMEEKVKILSNYMVLLKIK